LAVVVAALPGPPFALTKFIRTISVCGSKFFFFPSETFASKAPNKEKKSALVEIV
jgi:hypothetical protein